MRLLMLSLFIALSAIVQAQNSDLILRASDTLNFTLFIEGNEYKVDGASYVKIVAIPEAALLNVTGMLISSTPMAFFERLEFKGSFEWQYELVVPKSGGKLTLKLITKTEKTEDFKSLDLGQNFVVYQYGKYISPLERVSGTVDARSSIKSTRTNEESPTTVTIEEGKKVEKKEERKQTITEGGSNTVIHTERKTTGDGDEREMSILKPRKENCEIAWDAATKAEQMALLLAEVDESGKLYMSKVIAIKNCMTCDDAGEILAIYESEATRIEMAKFIYPSITDTDNFEILAKYFNNKSSWEAVELYIDVKYK